MGLRRQRGLSLMQVVVWGMAIAILALAMAKLLPAYLDYYAVKKIFATMQQAGDTKGTVRDIRVSFDRRNSVEGVKDVKGDDLEITKEGGETVITASWSVRVPMMHNLSACLDFVATTSGAGEAQ